jgi:ABC-type multidrug transport system permease subunit
MDEKIIFYLTEVLFVGINLLMAAYHCKLILENRPIRHWFWGGLYVLLIVPFWFLTRNPILMICLFLVREVSFSPALNKFRDLPFFYSNPKTNLHDRIEGKSQVVFYFIALISFILFNIIQLL